MFIFGNYYYAYSLSQALSDNISIVRLTLDDHIGAIVFPKV